MSYKSLKDGDLLNPISLGEFFMGLNGLMQLPPKPPEPEQKRKRPLKSSRFVLPLVAVVFAVALVALKPSPKADATLIPDGLVGLWETKASKYKDRLLEISPTLVVFYNGPAREDRSEHLITQIKTKAAGDTVMVTFFYLEAGTDYELSIKYSTMPERGIRFTNQDDLVWRPSSKPVPGAASPAIPTAVAAAP